MATTMLPFLYQTRTIQRLARSTPTHLAFRSLLHTTSTHHLPINRRDWRSQNPDVHNHDPIPFELPEDLASDPRFNPPPEFEEDEVGDESTAAAGTITPKERRAFNDIFQEIARTAHETYGDATSEGRQRLTDSPSASSTGHAQNIISTILSDATQNLASTAQPHQDLLKSMRQLHNIDPLGRSAGSEMTPQQRYEKLISFPPSLRNAAKRALGILEPGGNTQPDRQPAEEQAMKHPEHMPLDPKEYLAARKSWASQFIEAYEAEPVDDSLQTTSSEELGSTLEQHRNDRIELQVEAERSRYQEELRLKAIMSETKSDFELWDVLEREIFSMISRLGLDKAEGSKPSRRSNEKKNRAPEAPGSSSASVTEPPPQLDLMVHGPLYASHLVSGLKAMDQRFPGSPLALSILPRVKSLGLASYILGASVDLYTAQMNLCWNRYRDVRAVLDLMNEMKSAELTFDRQHWLLLEQMELRMVDCIGGNRGDVLGNILVAPEWATLLATQFPTYRNWINRDLRKREGPPRNSAIIDDART